MGHTLVVLATGEGKRATRAISSRRVGPDAVAVVVASERRRGSWAMVTPSGLTRRAPAAPRAELLWPESWAARAKRRRSRTSSWCSPPSRSGTWSASTTSCSPPSASATRSSRGFLRIGGGAGGSARRRGRRLAEEVPAPPARRARGGPRRPAQRPRRGPATTALRRHDRRRAQGAPPVVDGPPGDAAAAAQPARHVHFDPSLANLRLLGDKQNEAARGEACQRNRKTKAATAGASTRRRRAKAIKMFGEAPRARRAAARRQGVEVMSRRRSPIAYIGGVPIEVPVSSDHVRRAFMRAVDPRRRGGRTSLPTCGVCCEPASEEAMVEAGVRPADMGRSPAARESARGRLRHAHPARGRLPVRHVGLGVLRWVRHRRLQRIGDQLPVRSSREAPSLGHSWRSTCSAPGTSSSPDAGTNEGACAGHADAGSSGTSRTPDLASGSPTWPRSAFTSNAKGSGTCLVMAPR